MNSTYSIGIIVALLGLASCTRQDAAPPVDPQAVEDAAERKDLFGDRAAAPGIVWRTSGLGVRILQPGEGALLRMEDRVRVHYTGTLKDGTVFDSSRTKGKPADFPVKYLVPGLSVALTSLKSGAHAEIFIPPVLGYGNIRSGNIPANSSLIFDIEILAVNP